MKLTYLFSVILMLVAELCCSLANVSQLDTHVLREDLDQNQSKEKVREAARNISQLFDPNRTDSVDHALIQTLIDEQLMPRIIELLGKFDFVNPARIYCSNIVRGMANGTPEQVNYLVQHNVIEALMKALSSQQRQVVVDALWSLSRIARIHVQFRDTILAHLINIAELVLDMIIKNFNPQSIDLLAGLNGLLYALSLHTPEYMSVRGTEKLREAISRLESLHQK